MLGLAVRGVGAGVSDIFIGSHRRTGSLLPSRKLAQFGIGVRCCVFCTDINLHNLIPFSLLTQSSIVC
jgi:hypothetical protein